MSEETEIHLCQKEENFLWKNFDGRQITPTQKQPVKAKLRNKGPGENHNFWEFFFQACLSNVLLIRKKKIRNRKVFLFTRLLLQMILSNVIFFKNFFFIRKESLFLKAIEIKYSESTKMSLIKREYLCYALSSTKLCHSVQTQKLVLLSNLKSRNESLPFLMKQKRTQP